MIAGEIKCGEDFFLSTGGESGRWFRRLNLSNVPGILPIQVLPDAATGIPTIGHQNSLIVQECRTGSFFWIDTDVPVEQPSDEEEDG